MLVKQAKEAVDAGLVVLDVEQGWVVLAPDTANLGRIAPGVIAPDVLLGVFVRPKVADVREAGPTREILLVY